MNVIKPLQLGLIARTFVKDRRYFLSVASLSYFPFHCPNALSTEQEMWETIFDALDKDSIFDLGIPKPRSEVLMVGKCYAPKRIPVERLYVDLDFGAVAKRVVVTGNRYWAKGDRTENFFGRLVGYDWEMTRPEPFVELDMGWRNAFGGPCFPENPLGKGCLSEGESPRLDNLSPLPNIERPERMMALPSSVASPAGYGPFDVAWPQRAEKAGTDYGKKWMKERFPEPAEDMDPTYYNSAPEDQQLQEGFWRGDEAFTITHMHPDCPRQESALPQIRPRCFVLQRHGERDRWNEVSLHPETVWLFPNVSHGILVSRGTTEIDTFYGVDVDTLLLAWELKQGRMRSPEAYRSSVAARENEETADDWMMREDDLSPPEGIPEEPLVFAEESRVDINDTYGPLLERASKSSEAMLAKLKETASAVGLDPNRYFGALPVPPLSLPAVPALEKMSDIPAILEYSNGQSAACDRELEDAFKDGVFVSKNKAEAEKKAELKAREICKNVGHDYDELLAISKANPPSEKPTLDRFRDLLNSAKKQLSDHPGKLKELDKAMGKLDSASQKLASEKGMPAMKMGGDVDSAHLGDPPDRPPKKVLDMLRVWVLAQHENGAGCKNADLSYVDLSGLSLSGLDLDGAILDSANLEGADLSYASLSEAVLARAQASKATLTGANLERACLGKATLDGADLTGARLNESYMEQTSFVGAALTGAEIKTEVIYDCDFRESELSDAVLTDAEIIECNFSKATLKRAMLVKTSFATCNLVATDFSEACLTETTFVEVNASYSRFDRAQMTDTNAHLSSKFCNASFVAVDAESVNFGQTDLSDSDFRTASLNESDFSESTLARAKFDWAIARESNFTDADLTDASFHKTDLMQASLQNAILMRTRFTGAHLFEADFLFAAYKDLADFSGAITKRALLGDGQ